MADDLDPNEPDDLEQEAELQRQIALVPPELYETLQPLLLLASVANYMLVGHADDPVPKALHELLGYDIGTVKRVSNVRDTPTLARVMATNTLEMFDFVLVARLVSDSSLMAHLGAYLTRHDPDNEGFAASHGFLVDYSESLLETLHVYLASDDDDLGEELRMRRLQTESIFARLDDTLRPFYPAGHSPDELRAQALDAADEEEDQEPPAVHVSFSAVQRTMLGTALRLPHILADLGETAFGRALAGVARFRRKALERLAARLTTADPDQPFALTWSELLRLYQAAQVCALSNVADVLAVGSLEDVMRHTAEAHDETPEEVARIAHHTRELMTAVMAGFVEIVEHHHADDEEVVEAKAEISRLAELLVQ